MSAANPRKTRPDPPSASRQAADLRIFSIGRRQHDDHAARGIANADRLPFHRALGEAPHNLVLEGKVNDHDG